MSVFALVCVVGFHSAFNATGQTIVMSPLDNAVNVEPTVTQFELAFTEDVRVSAAGGTFSISKGGALIKTIPVSTTSTDAYVSGKKFIVIHGLGNLTEGADYALALTNGALEYKNSATTWAPVGAIVNTAWNFTIGDYTSPMLATSGPLTPADNATKIDAKATSFQLVMKFNEDVLKGEEGNVYIYKNNGTIVDMISIADVTVATNTVTVPVSDNAIWEELTSYYVIVDAGAITDASANKNPFAGITSSTAWNFETRDYSAPTIVSKTASDITTTTAKLNVSLSEAGKYYYVLQTASTPDITIPATVKSSGTAVTVSAANTVVSANLTVLGSTAYEIFIVTENAMSTSPDLSTTIAKVTFSSVDDVNPTASANTEVANTAKQTVGLKITFTEAVTASGTGVVEIKKQLNNEIVRSIAASAITVTTNATAADPVATMWYVNIPFAALDSKADYYAIVPAGLIKDLAENPFAGYTSTTAWQFVSSDYEKPVSTLSASTWSSGKVGALDADIWINFNEAVLLVDGVAAWSDAVAFELNNETVASVVTYDGTNNRIVINPDANLTSNTTYTLKLRVNSVEDDNENVADAKTFNVITGDLDAKLITINVPNGLANEAVNPTIEFSKNARMVSGDAPITPATLAAAISFTKTNPTTGNVAFTVTYNSSTFVATVIPSANLASSGQYSLDINGALFESVSENAPFPDPAAEAFEVRDYTKPAVALSHEGDETMAVTDNVTITITDVNTLSLLDGTTINDSNVDALVTFKKDGVSGANLAFDATYAAGVITINPTADLDFDDTYYYGIGASIKDAQGNIINAKYGTFTAKEDMGPVEAVVTGYSPAINAISVTTNTSGNLVATLTFDRQLRAGSTIGASAELWNGGSAIATDAITTGDINGNILTLTFTGVAPLTSSAEYYITVPAAVVEGNATVTTYYPQFAGIAANVWKFKSKDTVAPTGTGVPADGSSGIALNADIEVTFTEPIDLGTGNILIKEGVGGTTIQTIAVNSSNVTVAANKLSAKIIHANLAKYSTVYEVTVPGTAFKDTAANIMAAVVWSFTTTTNPAPTATTLVPADNADLVSLATPFSMTFSEPIQKGAAGHTIFLVKKNGATRAILAGGGTINLGTDVLVKSVLVEDAAVGVAGNIAQINFGVTLEADKEYFVLVEPGTFKDMSLPTAADYNDLDVYGEWNFNTGDVNPPTYTVSYTERGTDMMTYNSDITLTFNKPIEKASNVAINSVDIATLFNVTVDGAAVSFTGTIDGSKTIVVLNNSTFNPAITMANSGQNVVVTSSSLYGAVSNAPVLVNETITIGDYMVPTLIASVSEGTNGTSATATFSSTETGTVYYIYQTGTASTSTPDASVVKGGTPVAVTVGTPVDKSITGLTSQTSYVMFSVAEDAVGNTTAVDKQVFVTPDVTKPVLAAATLPTTFTAGKLKIKFSENVNPNGAVVKLYNKATGVYYGESALVVVSGTALSNDTLITGAFTLPTSVTEFYAEVEGGIIADGATLKFDGIYRPTWVITTVDETAPMLVSDETTDFTERQAADANFTFTFNEDVKLVSPVPAQAFFIEYWNGTTYEPYEIVDPANVTVNGAEVTVNPSRNFAVSSSESMLKMYKITVKENAIEDIAGNDYGAGSLSYVFNIVDATPATATFGPEPILATTSSLTITFNEELFMLDGTVLDNWDVDSLVTFTLDGAAFAFDASVSTVPNTSTTITIVWEDGDFTDYKGDSFTYGFKAAFEDLSGNVVTSGSKSFVVPLDPVVSPVVIFSPNNGVSATATSVPIDQVFTITFNGQLYTWDTDYLLNNLPVTAEYLEDDGVTLYDEDDDVYIDFTANITTWNSTSTIVTITPDESLVSEHEYTLAVEEFMVQLGTANVSSLGYTDNWYKANDAIAPVLDTLVDTDIWENGIYPVSGTVIAKTESLKLTFVEQVKEGTASIKIYRWDGVLAKTVAPSSLSFSGDKKTVTITSLSDLPTNVEYYVIVPNGAIVDLAGNPYAGITVINKWKLTVQDDNIPHYVSLNPVGDDVVVNANLTIEFDRPVVLGATGFVAVYKNDGTAVQLINIADGIVPITFAGNVVTINVNEFEQSTAYKVEVGEGTFKTTTGVIFEGISSSDWSFTTENNSAPQIITNGLTPADDASVVVGIDELVMMFDRDVMVGSGTLDLHADDGIILLQVNVSSEEVTIAGAKVTVNIGDILEANKSYYVIVNNGFVTNTSATPEKFAGLLQPTSWNFSVEEIECPGVDFAVTEIEQMECSALINISVDTLVTDYTLTLNDSTVMAGDHVLVAGSYTAIVYSLDGACKDEKMFEVGTMPVVREVTVETNIGQPVHFVDVEAGIDTMLTVGVHTITYDYMDCVRTLIVTVVEEIITPMIAEIQGEGDESPLAGQMVKVNATVTAVAPGEGFFMQDANAAWSGIWVEFSGATFEGIQIGNGVMVSGEVAEVANVTSIVDATMEFVPPMVTIAEMLLASPSDLEAEKYESVLVKVKGAEATAVNAGTGEWTIFYTQNDNAIVNDWLYVAMVEAGHYYDVIGIVNGRLDNFKLEPRDVLDVKDLTLTDVKADLENSFSVYPNPFNDRITIENSDKVSRVVVSNIAGQRVIDIEYPTREIRTANLVSGIYIISLYTENGVAKTERMIKR